MGKYNTVDDDKEIPLDMYEVAAVSKGKHIATYFPSPCENQV